MNNIISYRRILHHSKGETIPDDDHDDVKDRIDDIIFFDSNSH
jgi:hypothetical protein